MAQGRLQQGIQNRIIGKIFAPIRAQDDLTRGCSVPFGASMCEVSVKERNRSKMHDRLTRQDIEKIEKEIEERKLVKRPELIEAVKEARAQGDLSENFEYYAAKKAKNQNESRIRFLERMIKTARVIEDRTTDDQVGMNKTVTVKILEDDTEETYKIVTTMRQNSLKGLISIESPLGKQLLGHKVGDRVNIKVSDNYSYEISIIKIENTGLSDEDKIRDF